METYEDLADRVRDELAGRSVREVRMFGGLAFMVDDRMVVSVGGDGSLLVRVDPDRDPDLLGRPGARRAEMGTGRDMGPGWISVDPAAVATAAGLRGWLDQALAFHGATRGGRR